MNNLFKKIILLIVDILKQTKKTFIMQQVKKKIKQNENYNHNNNYPKMPNTLWIV